MRYTVVWSNTAQDRLAQLWGQSSHQQAFTKAADLIDRLLGMDPLRQATACGDRLFTLSVGPLIVVFSLHEEDRQVAVEEVWELGPLDA